MKAILFLFLTLLPITALGENALFRAIDKAVISAMEEQNVVCVAIGVIGESKIVYTKGYGYADVDLNVSVTEDTIFNWASNSKPVIAVAAMQLVENGQLDLDKPIAAYISDLPHHLKNITSRQLLSHQSGIPHYDNGEIKPRVKPKSTSHDLDPLNSLNRFIMSPLILPPEQEWNIHLMLTFY